MTSLSEKALAFSVDNLLGNAEKQRNDGRKRESARDTYKEELCASMGKEPACCHRNVMEVLGKWSKLKCVLCIENQIL